jgi:MarR family transcriptional regulator, organic hydroperoxide resistance regulator
MTSTPGKKGERGDCPTRAQMATLMVLSHVGPQTIKDLAERFGMSPSAVTQTVDGLVEERLLERREGEDDRRQVFVSLTAKGKTMAAEAKKEQFKSMTKLLEPLSDEELIVLMTLHQKIIRA